MRSTIDGAELVPCRVAKAGLRALRRVCPGSRASLIASQIESLMGTRAAGSLALERALMGRSVAKKGLALGSHATPIGCHHQKAEEA